ncbi:MAG: murein biosynthesis integral membrane protein MurJ [Deltaproteobacteria bacterium]|nr:murein biosynthesis integral membrane protein MurJ [Deltaproteobacteria bacterium]
MKSSFQKNIVTVGGLTGISRILGFGRDLVMAWLLGAGPVADAFIVAFRIPNLLRRLFAEGAVSVAFVPVFNEIREREGLGKALFLARNVITLMLLVLCAIVLIGELIAPLLVSLIAPGFLGDPIFSDTVSLTRIMFPYILLVGMLALLTGILNSLGHFAAPAAAPIVLNVFMISIPLLLHAMFPVFASAADAFAWGVVLGGLAQLALQIGPLKRLNVTLKPSFHFKDTRIRQIVRLLGVAAVAASIYQINVFIGTMLATLLPLAGSVAFLYYANRIMELPLGIFAFAVGSVMLPAMSRASARVDTTALSILSGRAISTVLLFTIPASVGIYILAEPIISILFVRGAFSTLDALLTAQALRMYALALWAIGVSRILIQALYAMQQAATVVRVSAYVLGINVVFSVILMSFLQHAGLALANSISVFFQLLFLARILKRNGVRLSQGYYARFGKMVLAAVLMGLCIYPFVRMRFWIAGFSLKSVSILIACIGVGAGVYFGTLLLMGIRYRQD